MALRPKVKDWFSYNSAALFLGAAHRHSLSPLSSFLQHVCVGWCWVWKLLLLAWRKQAVICQGKAPRRVLGNPDTSPAVETKPRSSDLCSFIRLVMEAVRSIMFAFCWHFSALVCQDNRWKVVDAQVLVKYGCGGVMVVKCMCIGHCIWVFVLIDAKMKFCSSASK